MTGIELLQMVKENKLEDRTLIRTTGPFPQYYLFRKNGEHPNFSKCDDEGKAGGMYGQYKFMTTRALFRDYEIVEVLREVPNKIEKLYHIFNDNNEQETYYKLVDEMFYKINELIDAVNYLLDTQNN